MPAPVEPDPLPQKLTLSKAEFERVNEPVPVDSPMSGDPMEMLRQNRAHEKVAGTVYDQSPEPGPGKYRKYRDYLVVLIAVDAVLGYSAFTLSGDPYGFVPIVAGLLLFSAGWSWFMLVVVDDY